MKRFTLKQLFSVVDGRLSTKMDDVYSILNIVSDNSLSTIGLTIVMENLEKVKPEWFIEAKKDLNKIKKEVGNDFNNLMDYLNSYQKTYLVSKM